MSLLDAFRRPTRRADPAARRAAIADLFDPVELTWLVLNDPDPGVRIAATARCPSAMALVWTAMRAPERAVRDAAIGALGGMPDLRSRFGVEVQPEVEKLLAPARQVLGVDAEALGRALVTLLEGELSSEQRAGILGLTSEPGRVLLAVSHPRADVRRDAARLAPASELVSSLARTRAEIGAEALSAVVDPEMLAQVARDAADDDLAISAISRIDRPDLLVALTQSELPLARRVAALARVDDLAFIHTIAASRHPVELRVAALRRMMSRRSADQLRALLTDREPQVRRMALERWDTVTPSHLALPHSLVSRLASDSDPSCRALALAHVLDAALLETRAATDPDADPKAAAIARLAGPWTARTRRIAGADEETRFLALRWLGRDVVRHFPGMSLEELTAELRAGRGPFPSAVSLSGRLHQRPVGMVLSTVRLELRLGWHNPLAPLRLLWDPAKAPGRMSNDDQLPRGWQRVFVAPEVFVEGDPDPSAPGGIVAALGAWGVLPLSVAGPIRDVMANLRLAELTLEPEAIHATVGVGCFDLPDPLAVLDAAITATVRVHNAVVQLTTETTSGPVQVVRCRACGGRFNAASRVSCPSCGTEAGEGPA